MSVGTFFSTLFGIIKKIFLNKYLIVLVSFTVYITFFDANNLINRWESNKKIKELEQEYDYYQEEIKKNKQQLHLLRTSDEYLEQFAREKYLMRNKGEEIYLIKE